MNSSSVTRYVRYLKGNETAYGIIEGDKIQPLDGFLLDNPQPMGQHILASEVTLTIPIEPARVSKIIGVTGNYQATDAPVQTVIHPPLFAKFATSLVTDGDDVVLPPELKDPYHAGGLVVVIGKKGRNISLAEASSFVFGVAVGNDISDGLSWGRDGGTMVPDRLMANATDTWAPIGTEIVTGLDYSDLEVEARLNGKIAATGRTSQLIHSVEKLIYYASHYFTLMPGDLFYTGTPPVSQDQRTIGPGDVMEIVIDGVGSLRNSCVQPKEGFGRQWWHEQEEKLAAEEAAARPAGAN